MRALKYGDGWTRRHFLGQASKGILAAGVLAPLWEVIGNTGSCEAAYPPELLSIEAYTKGKLKVGQELNAGNVDIVKDILTPAAYFQIKHDGRLVDLAPTTTELDHLTPKPFLEATIKNRGVHVIGKDGNVWTRDGKPWIGGNPFPEPKTPQECLMANTLSWGKHDAFAGTFRDSCISADGYAQYNYDVFYVEWQTVGRQVLDPKPYMPGHETQLRYFPMFINAPEDVRGTSFLQIWAYDEHLFPDFYGYTPLLKRTRNFPTDQRFEPRLPGNVVFASEDWFTGDPLLTWGNFKLVGKGPLLTGAGHCADLDQPNWAHKTCGGKTGKKYFRTRMELVPECYICELEPIKYPRSPFSKKRIWYDARTLAPQTMACYDRRGKLWHQYEGGFSYYQRKPGTKWIEGVPEQFWAWTFLHCHDLQSNRLETYEVLQEISGGFHTDVDKSQLYSAYCSLEALRRLGR